MPRKTIPFPSQPEQSPEDGLLKIAQTAGEMPYRLDRASPETLNQIHEQFLSAFRALEILILTSTDPWVRATSEEQLKRMRQWARDYSINTGGNESERRRAA